MQHRVTPAAVTRVTIAACRRAWAAEFRLREFDSPELDARVLVGHALGLDHAELAARADQPLSAEQQGAIAGLARRRLGREPVARITGIKEFWSLPLRVTGATLVPRPETETIVTAALAALDKRGPRSRAWRIADIGTGSGAIMLALLSELPNAVAVGTDISAAALAVASDNASRLRVCRAAYVVCDIASALSGPFDLIVSNPPYIASADLDRLAPEVRLFDPRVALDGGADGLHWHRALAQTAAPLLAHNGVLVVELGKDQAEPVGALFAAAGLAPVAPQPDLNAVPRALIAGNVRASLTSQSLASQNLASPEPGEPMTRDIAGQDSQVWIGRSGLQMWPTGARKKHLEYWPEPISLRPTESPLNEGAALP